MARARAALSDRVDATVAPARASRCPSRTLLVAGVAVALLAEVLLASPQRVGDGPEYLAMALQLAQLRRPSLSELDVENTRARFKRLDRGFEEQNGTIDLFPLKAADHRVDCPHFWFYSALAAPGVRLAEALGLHPNYGFVVTNVALVLLAVWVVSARLDWPATLILFTPILWWIDKAHTEAFTFSLLALGMALVDRPWWSMVAFAAASTQNLPIVVAVPLVGVLALRPELRRDDRVLAGAVAAIAVAALHPLYYLARLGVAEPQMVAGGTHFHRPSWLELRSFVLDPNIGILPAFPALAAVLVGALAVLARREPRALLRAPVLLAATLAVVFLVCFAQTTNFNSGATAGPARYGLWLVPLAIPVLRAAEAHAGRWWRRALPPLAVVAAAWTLVAYRPGLPESYLTPTRLAGLLWERLPSADDPLPEIFVERITGKEVYAAVLPPAATRSCSKVLLVEGRWPPGCVGHGDVPAECDAPRAYCWANRRTDGDYGFTPTR